MGAVASQWRRVALALAVALVGATAIAVRSYRRAPEMVHPPRSHVTAADETDAKRELPRLEDVSFRTADDLTLRGWFSPGSRRAAIVFVHGGGGNRAQMLPAATILARHGYGILLYDSRANGESDGDLVTWGDREQRDVAAALDFVSARAEIDPARIGVVGFSIGASTVALEAAHDPRARAVVLCATWTSMDDEIAHTLGRYGPLSVLPLRFALARQGLDVSAIRPIDHVAEIAPRPLLLVTGADDTDTPVSVMERVLAAARAPKELWIEPGATHGSYPVTDPAEYERRVVGFFDRSL